MASLSQNSLFPTYPFPLLGADLGTTENCQLASNKLLLIFGTTQYTYRSVMMYPPNTIFW